MVLPKTANANTTTLPVELLRFEAEPAGGKVILKRETATEINNDYFTIERSEDGVAFEALKKEPGAGNSLRNIVYTSYDDAPFLGTSYYRLKQTDFDGTSVYSAIKKVNLVNIVANPPSLSLWPNPNNGRGIKVSLNDFAEESEVLVVLKNALGVECYSKIIVTEVHSKTVFGIDLNQKLTPGIYLVVASSDNALLSKKVVVK